MKKETNGNLIVRRIDEILVKRNATRAQLCRDLELKSNTLSTWLSRGTIPSADTALNIAQYLSVSVHWLIYGENDNLNNDDLKLISLWRELSADDKAEIMNSIEFKIKKALEKNTSAV